MIVSDGLRDEAALCFDVISAKLNSTAAPASTKIDKDAAYPLFVTWNTISASRPGQKRLRGCIGNFELMPLAQGLTDYAKISAFKDHRFRPISLSELPKLSCGVSLLTAFEPCADAFDWSLDTHGIYIQFPNPALYANPPPAPPLPASDSYSSLSSLPKYDLPPGEPRNPHREQLLLNATYLPGVATEQGWTKEEAVLSAMQKAGWNGEVDDAMLRSVRVIRYQSLKGELSYDEWQQMRSE